MGINCMVKTKNLTQVEMLFGEKKNRKKIVDYLIIYIK